MPRCVTFSRGVNAFTQSLAFGLHSVHSMKPQKLTSSTQLHLRSHQPQLSGPRSAQGECGNLSLSLLLWVEGKKFKKMKNSKKILILFFFLSYHLV